MALPTPIEMPSPLPVRAKSFDLNYNQLITPVGSGFSQTIERGPSLWVASYETPPLRDERNQKFQAFLDELEGSQGTFLAFDPRHARPYAYRDVGGEPWVQTGQVSARVTAGNATNSTLSLDRMQNGAVLTPHDYIAYKVGRAWYLHRVVVGGIVAGNTITVKVKARPKDFAVPYNARLNRPCCAMKIMGRIEKRDSVDSFPVYRFTAGQFVDKSTDP